MNDTEHNHRLRFLKTLSEMAEPNRVHLLRAEDANELQALYTLATSEYGPFAAVTLTLEGVMCMRTPIPEDHCSGELRWVYNGRDDCEPVLQQLWMIWDHDKQTITPEWRRVPEFEEAQQ